MIVLIKFIHSLCHSFCTTLIEDSIRLNDTLESKYIF